MVCLDGCIVFVNVCTYVCTNTYEFVSSIALVSLCCRSLWYTSLEQRRLPFLSSPFHTTSYHPILHIRFPRYGLLRQTSYLLLRFSSISLLYPYFYDRLASKPTYLHVIILCMFNRNCFWMYCSGNL